MPVGDSYGPLMLSRWPEAPGVAPEIQEAADAQALHPAPDLFRGLNARDLAAGPRGRLDRLQSRINQRYASLSIYTYAEADAQPESTTGFNPKILVEATCEGRFCGRFLHKPMSSVDAAKVEFVTILTNLLGLYTPLSIKHHIRVAGNPGYTQNGISTRFLENAQVSPDYDFRKASPEVLRYILLSRWINELVGNLHCWWAQFLIPRGASRTYDVMVMIDMDDAFNSAAPEFLQRALESYFGLRNIPVENCRWLHREFSLEKEIAWCPDHYDSGRNIYGGLFRDFVLGYVDIDIESCLPSLSRAGDIPAEVFANAMSGFLDASTAYYKNPWVFLPAAQNPKHGTDSFRERFIARIRRSIPQFRNFMDELGRARMNPEHEMYKFYSSMPDWRAQERA
jgi:hypothetical protein